MLVLADDRCRPRCTVPSASLTSSASVPAEQPGLEVGALAGLVGRDVLDPDAADRAAAARRESSVVDDELLGDVDEATGEVAGVGGAQRGVDEALAGARRGDEVLEHRQALTEVRLDRAGDHVATGVGHQAAHAGDLADLHHVPSGTRADHHVDGVELLGLERLSPSPRGPRRWPSVQISTSFWRRSPSVMMPRRNWSSTLSASLLVAVEDAGLLDRRLDVVDRDRQARLRGVAEAEVLDGVEAAWPRRPSGTRWPAGRRSRHDPLVDPLVDVLEASGGSVPLKKSRPAVVVEVAATTVVAVVDGSASGRGTRCVACSAMSPAS